MLSAVRLHGRGFDVTLEELHLWVGICVGSLSSRSAVHSPLCVQRAAATGRHANNWGLQLSAIRSGIRAAVIP